MIVWVGAIHLIEIIAEMKLTALIIFFKKSPILVGWEKPRNDRSKCGNSAQ